MFLRLVYQSFHRQRRRKLLAGIAITLGVAVATAMIAVATDIGDKINRELRTFGANIVVYPDTDTLDVEIGGVNLKPPPDGAYLNEADLPAIKGTFWRHNIVAFAPFLPVTADASLAGRAQQVELVGTWFANPFRYGPESFNTGARATNPWWKVEGAWPADDASDVLVGEALAGRTGTHIGDAITVAGRELKVAGILSAGPAENQQIVAPLHVAQEIAGRPGAVRRVLVSALTKPEDALARRGEANPKSLSPELYDRWYCSPYANAIAYQLTEAIPHSRAEQIRQVAQNEGVVLARIKGLMLLVTLAALLASALAVSAAMATAIFERRREVGLMKALGAGNISVAALFFTEAGLLALIGGTAGFLIGIALAEEIGKWIFSARIAVEPVLFPVVLAMAVLVTFAGSAASIRRAMHFSPAIVLRGDA
ncbi:MAG TPA: ABC transporter permease [Terriglobales bacterium]|nr:ABC transporter permease [Terriglobales bacterium]